MPNNKMAVNFESSVPCVAVVTWGALPARNSVKSERITMNGTGRITVPLPEKEAQGVKIILEGDGLRAEWPEWDYDVQGKLPLAEPLSTRPRFPGAR
jgi:hypothetical protein